MSRVFCLNSFFKFNYDISSEFSGMGRLSDSFVEAVTCPGLQIKGGSFWIFFSLNECLNFE